MAHCRCRRSAVRSSPAAALLQPRGQHPGRVTLPPPRRHHVVSDVAAGLGQFRGEVMPDHERAQVVLAGDIPEIGHPDVHGRPHQLRRLGKTGDCSSLHDGITSQVIASETGSRPGLTTTWTGPLAGLALNRTRTHRLLETAANGAKARSERALCVGVPGEQRDENLGVGAAPAGDRVPAGRPGGSWGRGRSGR